MGLLGERRIRFVSAPLAVPAMVFLPLPRVPTRQQVHSVIRTPNGNDYGKDLLRQHYRESHHTTRP